MGMMECVVHRYKMSLAEKEKKESKDTKAQDKVDNNSK